MWISKLNDQMPRWRGTLVVLFTMLAITSSGYAKAWWTSTPFSPRMTSYVLLEARGSFLIREVTMDATSQLEACTKFDPTIKPINYFAPEPAHYFNQRWTCGETAAGNIVLVQFIKPICPEHSKQLSQMYWVGYCLCDQPYVPDNKLDCVLSGFDISLVGDTEIEPTTGSSAKHLPFIVTIKDKSTNQPPTPPVTVKVSLKVDPSSGGHDHGDNTRPRGSIAGTECKTDDVCKTLTTDSNGIVNFDFTPPEASGKHTITVTCDRCSNGDSKEVEVKVAGLEPIPASPLYALTYSNGDVIGAFKNVHEANHFLLPSAILTIGKLANLYRTKANPGSILYLNDASLKWGGLFDVGATQWSTPHTTHNRGLSLDIRAQNSFPIREGAVPISAMLKFVTLAKRNRFKVALHCKGSTVTSVCYGRMNNRHFHVDF